MKEYDIIVIGSGSSVSIVDAYLRQNPGAKAAVIDKDEPGGICLTRGCIPSKILLYSAEVVRTIERAKEFGVDASIRAIHFDQVMERMRSLIGPDIAAIRQGLGHSSGLDFFSATAEFVAPYTLKVSGETIRSKRIVLGLGSESIIPRIRGLSEVGYLTSDTVLSLQKLPSTLAIIGGGYIAAEYGHFFASMGSKVTIIGRNPQFLPAEDPEISEVARRSLGRTLTILTNHEVTEVRKGLTGKKQVVATDRATGRATTTAVDELVVASGRGPTTAYLHAERGGIELDANGWVRVNEQLETSQPGVYAVGDATGRYLFKHKANYDAKVVYYNLVRGEHQAADYHAVPHAVFTDPEVAGVGWTEPEARRSLPPGRLLIGRYQFADTAKGEAMGLKDSGYFVKVLVDSEGTRIVGGQIVGPEASVLIQEVVDLMYTAERSARSIIDGMHIHPALSEVVERAFLALVPADHHHHSN